MKKNISTIISLVSCALVILCLVRINELDREINSLRTNQNSQFSMVNNNISGIYSNVQSMLEEESKQISSCDWEYGKMQADTRTVEVILSVTPKAYTPDVTVVSVDYGKNNCELTYTGSDYRTVIEIPLFETTNVSQLRMEDSGTIRTQDLNWSFCPYTDFLMTVNGGMSGSARGTENGGEYVWTADFTTNIDVYQYGEYEIRSIEIAEVLDGEEIGRIPVDISDEAQAAYYKAIAESAGDAVPEKTVNAGGTSASLYEGNSHFIYYLNKEYRIPAGSMLELYVDVTDGNGLRYRALLNAAAADGSGNADESRADQLQDYILNGNVLIYDQEGTVLYNADPTLFK